ncbi:MAG: hypothetical protein IK130_00230 [Oscillospiraceae bacterium]|nr:hypothetical protein [Oscillospiraceae bacterium]
MEIRTVEISAENKMTAALRAADIKQGMPQVDACFIERDWKVACEYLERFTSPDGVCHLNFDTELDGNTLDYAKNVAVFMIMNAMMQNGTVHMLPMKTAMRVTPYVQSRIAALQINMAKYSRLNSFMLRALHLLKGIDQSDESVDDVFAEIFSDIPSVQSFAAAVTPDRAEQYLPVFEMLHEKAQACADPYYAKAAEEYLEVLGRENEA